MTLPHRIYIEPAYQKDGRHKVTERGPQFEATYEGELICVSHQPLLDGARVLRQRGLTGPVETWDKVGQFRRMHSTIEKAARLEEPSTASKADLLLAIRSGSLSAMDFHLRSSISVLRRSVESARKCVPPAQAFDTLELPGFTRF